MVATLELFAMHAKRLLLVRISQLNQPGRLFLIRNNSYSLVKILVLEKKCLILVVCVNNTMLTLVLKEVMKMIVVIKELGDL